MANSHLGAIHEGDRLRVEGWDKPGKVELWFITGIMSTIFGLHKVFGKVLNQECRRVETRVTLWETLVKHDLFHAERIHVVKEDRNYFEILAGK